MWNTEDKGMSFVRGLVWRKQIVDIGKPLSVHLAVLAVASWFHLEKNSQRTLHFLVPSTQDLESLQGKCKHLFP